MSVSASAAQGTDEGAEAGAARGVMELNSVGFDLTGGGPFRRERRTVLDDVSFSLCQGETLAVIGRNGCGKSTLLRLMAGILAPTRGEVWTAPGLTRAVLAIGLGFRNDLSGRDNALLSAMLQGASAAQARANLEAIKEFSELGEAFERPVSTYSSGMRSRLGFSTGLITHVDVLFIDEVLAVGDGGFREKASEALKGRIRGDQTVVLVSHNMAEVRALADRVLWLEGGRVAQLEEPRGVIKGYRAALGQ